MNKQELELLRQEIEILMNERYRLLRVVGAAALLVTNADPSCVPAGVVNEAEILSEELNALSEESLKDALDSVNAQLDMAVLM